MPRVKKGSEKQKDDLANHNGIIFCGVVPFIPIILRPVVMTQAKETHLGKSTTEALDRVIEWRTASVKMLFGMLVKVMKAKNVGLAPWKLYHLARSRRMRRLYKDLGNVQHQKNIFSDCKKRSCWKEAFPAGIVLLKQKKCTWVEILQD